MSEFPSCDPKAALDFLQQWNPIGPWILTAISKERGKTSTQTFHDRDTQRLAAWIARHNSSNTETGRANIYFSVNSLHGDTNKKAKKADVASMDWVHVDIDCVPNGDLEAQVAEKEQLLLQFEPKPTAVLRSGGGVQGFWKLNTPVPLDDGSDINEAERVNRWVAQKLEGDNCHNIDRIMRVPGTVNWPDAKKQAKGRVPALAMLVLFDAERAFELDAFGKADPVVDAQESTEPNSGLSKSVGDLTPNLRHLIETGTKPDGGKFPSRSEAVFRVCCDMVRENADDESIAAVLLDPELVISKHVLEQSKPNQYARKQAEKARQTVADSLTLPLEQMNSQYCVVKDGGKTRVLEFVPQSETRDGKIVHRRETATYLSFEDLRNFYLSESIATESGKSIPLGHWWLKHPHRRQYEGLVFRPDAGEVVNGRLNLWRGWGVLAEAGDWSLMRQHIREVLAAGDEVADDYIVRWCAWAVQHPEQRAEVALVFQGTRGCGKGTLGNALVRLFGQHGTHISTAEHLAGRFNAHLRDACLLFADEAYWPGDKGAEGSLKRLITEPDLFIEAKFKDGFTSDNHLHVMMAANEDWVVPAGERERRFAVFVASDHKAQDESWFKPLYEEQANGGYEAMLYDLLAMDLGDWHPRRVPLTDALLKQQLRSLQPLDKWIVGLFEDGVLPGGNGSHVKSRARPDFEGRNPRDGLFDLARTNIPGMRFIDDQVLAEKLKQLGCEPKRFGSERVRGWKFPPLLECRAKWESRYPGWKWQEPDLEDWIVERDPDDDGSGGKY